MRVLSLVGLVLLLTACGIKGNLTTHNGEKIYHMPGDQFYDVTNAEQWFCSEEEAEEEGYRRSFR
ncbi:hypothetical protein ACFQ4X_07010 [Fictibacillus halophilus]